MIAAVIVLYKSTEDELNRVLTSVKSQVDKVYLVDNTPAPMNYKPQDANVEYAALGRNAGIAAAQNVGIKAAMKAGADYILCSDQDSILPEGMVAEQLETFKKLSGVGKKVACIGVQAVDATTGEPYPYVANYIRNLNGELAHIAEVTQTMSSGSIYPTSLFQEIGLLEEALFIDGVDSEICWRAKKLIDADSFVNENIKIKHSLGLGTKKAGLRSISITPPYRMFYMYRNYLWLCRRDYVPTKWKTYNGMKYLIKMFYYPLLKAPRLEYVKNIFNGIKAGMRKPE